MTPQYESANGDEPVAASRRQVRRVIGPVAIPDRIPIARGVPQTRSGEIMRRIVRTIAGEETDEKGDVTTLADPGVVDELLQSVREPLA